MIVGLTGGIGSGKSTVATMFKKLGIPVYIADLEARKLMNSSAVIRKEIIEAFGEASYHNDVPDRKFLADIVFKEKEKLQKLNTIVHPKVQQHFLDWYKRQTSPYVIKEAAILFESGGDKECDKIITVTIPVSERIKRVMKRDNITEEVVMARIKNQWPDERKIALSDFIIENTDINETQKTVKKIHHTLLENYLER